MSPEARDVAQLVVSGQGAGGSRFNPKYKLSRGVHSCNPITWEVETGSELHSPTAS